MGRVTGVCVMCGHVGTEVYKCGVCGATVCSSCFMRDINVCKRCLRKGLWVSDSGPK